MIRRKSIALLSPVALICLLFSSKLAMAADCELPTYGEMPVPAPATSMAGSIPAFVSAVDIDSAPKTASANAAVGQAASTSVLSPVSPPAIPVDAVTILELTNQTLFKEIDLERFDLEYHRQGHEVSKYRRLRYFLLQQAAGSAHLTANLVNTVETGKHFKTPNDVSGNVFLGTNCVGLTGAVLGSTSSSIELCSNGFLALKNKWTKKDPATARENFLTRVHEIDELLARRSGLVDRCANADVRSVYLAEGKVLKTFRDWCVYEFADTYSDIKSLQASNNVFYALDIGAYTVSFVAYILAIKTYNDFNSAYPSLHLGFVSDGLFTSEAPLGRIARDRLHSYWFNSLCRSLGERPRDVEAEAKKQMVHLEYLAANADDQTLSYIGPVAARLTVYSFWSTRYDKYVDRRMNEMSRQSRIALQSSIVGPLIGSTGLAQDFMSAAGLYRYRNDAFKQNAVTFAGSVTSTCSAAVSVGLTGWWFADQIINDKRNRRDQVLPEFLLQDRLKTLAVLEEMLRAARSQ
jgi:hypothetical protein